MTDELKPCPFCGGDAMTCFDDERMIFRHSVECIVCGGRSGWYSSIFVQSSGKPCNRSHSLGVSRLTM